MELIITSGSGKLIDHHGNRRGLRGRYLRGIEGVCRRVVWGVVWEGCWCMKVWGSMGVCLETCLDVGGGGQSLM